MHSLLPHLGLSSTFREGGGPVQCCSDERVPLCSDSGLLRPEHILGTEGDDLLEPSEENDRCHLMQESTLPNELANWLPENVDVIGRISCVQPILQVQTIRWWRHAADVPSTSKQPWKEKRESIRIHQ